MTSVRQFSQWMAAKYVFYAIDACYSGLALMKAGDLDMRDQQYLQKVARYPARRAHREPARAKCLIGPK